MSVDICVVTPYPPGRKELGGASWVDRRLLKALHDNGISTDLITVTGPEGSWREHGYTGSSAGSVPLELRSNRTNLARVALGMLRSTEPYLARKFTVFPGWRRAAELLRSRAADKPVLTSGWPALLLAVAAGIPIDVHIAHNVESTIAHEHAPTALRLLGEGIRLRHLERKLLSTPQRVFTLSKTDAHTLRSWGVEVEALPLPLIPQEQGGNRQTPAVGFLGKASWPPNASALRTLLGPVHEELERSETKVDYVLAGRGTEEFIHHPRVVSSGWVVDEADFYARIGLVVIPRFGASTGVSVKMLEAAEYGVASIVPRQLADAVDPDGPWFIADDPLTTAQAIQQWLADGFRKDIVSWTQAHNSMHTAEVLRAALSS